MSMCQLLKKIDNLTHFSLWVYRPIRFQGIEKALEMNKKGSDQLLF
jgi:hypothetical protein